jgi:hypothetical protein
MNKEFAAKGDLFVKTMLIAAIAAMLFLTPMAPGQQPTATNGAAAKLPTPFTLAGRVAALEKEVAALQKQLAAYAASAGKPVPPVADSWETQDLSDDKTTQKQSHRLTKTAKTLVVEYFEQRHWGGGPQSFPLTPPKQIVLVPGQDSALVLSPGPAFACSWTLGLSGDSNAAFNLTINQ